MTTSTAHSCKGELGEETAFQHQDVRMADSDDVFSQGRLRKMEELENDDGNGDVDQGFIRSKKLLAITMYQYDYGNDESYDDGENDNDDNNDNEDDDLR